MSESVLQNAQSDPVWSDVTHYGGLLNRASDEEYEEHWRRWRERNNGRSSATVELAEISRPRWWRRWK